MSDETKSKDRLKVVSINKDLPDDEEIAFEPDPDVISYLEILLEHAKEGSLTELIVISNYFGGVDQGGEFVGTASNPDAMLGALQRTSFRYHMWCDGIIFEDEE